MLKQMDSSASSPLPTAPRPLPTAPRPLPALAGITTRVATMDDLPFVDRLQKQHSKQLGFFPRAQIEGYIRNGWMRIAEEGPGARGQGQGEEGSSPSLAPDPSPLVPRPVGYIAFRDRYLKRDELGAVFQLCVEPGRQRGLIGATLLQSAFDASAYGCRLFCCWCAQDLAANHFWEAMGFVPIAFRVGGKGRGTRGKGRGKAEDGALARPSPLAPPAPRVHIFWQKRIRAGDETTPWWYPSGTDGGALRADRIVLPIPAGTHWSDAKPIVLPGEAGGEQSAVGREKQKRLAGPRSSLPTAHCLPPPRSINMGGLRWGESARTTPVVVETPKREPRAKVKTDPRLAAMARELRDRWLERYDDSGIAPARAQYAIERGGERMAVIEGEIVKPLRQIAA